MSAESLLDRPCADCGRPFFCVPSSPRLYCSIDCRWRANTRLRDEDRREKKKAVIAIVEPRPEVACAECGAMFIPKRLSNRFCSAPCQRKQALRELFAKRQQNQADALAKMSKMAKTCGNCKWGQVFKPGQGETGYWCGIEKFRDCMGLDMRAPKLWEGKT
jgi:hypothetical protein